MLDRLSPLGAIAALKSAGITPSKDANFPERFLKSAGITPDKAFILADQFNRGQLPDPYGISEQRIRQLVCALKTHKLYGRLKKQWAEKT